MNSKRQVTYVYYVKLYNQHVCIIHIYGKLYTKSTVTETGGNHENKLKHESLDIENARRAGLWHPKFCGVFLGRSHRSSWKWGRPPYDLGNRRWPNAPENLRGISFIQTSTPTACNFDFQFVCSGVGGNLIEYRMRFVYLVEPLFVTDFLNFE